MEQWATELEKSVVASEYELRLIGPVSSGVTKLKAFGKVQIPIPQPLNIQALIDQAAHRLDHYMDQRKLGRIAPIAREMVVSALATHLSTYSTKGQPISRGDLDAVLQEWLASISQAIGPGFAEGEPPHQVPPSPGDFIGRADALIKIRAEIAGGRKIIGIRGLGGIGKTALQLKVAEGLLEGYPDGQVHLDVRGTTNPPATPTEIMAYVIRSLRPNSSLPEDDAEYRGLCRTLLHKQRVLLTLDNVRSVDQLLPLLPDSEGLLLYTSREQLLVPNGFDLLLDVMTMEEAKEFVVRIVPSAGDLAAHIAQLCGYLPLALRIAASALRERPDITASDYVTRLSDVVHRLELVEASLELSVQLLAHEVRQCFLALAVFPGTFDLSAAATIWSLDQDVASTVMGKLLKSSLVIWVDNIRRYKLHDLVVLYVRKHFNPADTESIQTRLCTHYLAVCRLTAEIFAEDPLRALSLFDLERQNIELGFLLASGTARISDEAAQWCSDYAYASAEYRGLRQSPAEAIRWESAAFEAAKRLNNLSRIVPHLGNSALALKKLGRFQEALDLHRRILVVAQETNSPVTEVQALLSIGDTLKAMGKHGEAVQEFQRAAAKAKSIDNLPMVVQVDIPLHLAAGYLELGQEDTAFDYATEGLELAKTLGDPRFISSALSIAGEVGMNTGQTRFAINMFQESLKIAQSLKNIPAEASIRRSLMRAYIAAGNPLAAGQAMTDYLAFAQKIGDKSAEAGIVSELYLLRMAERNFPAAKDLAEQMLALAKAKDDKGMQITPLSRLANVAFATGKTEKAIDLLQSCIAIAREIASPRTEAREATRLAMIYRGLGKNQLALEYLKPIRAYWAAHHAQKAEEIEKYIKEIERDL